MCTISLEFFEVVVRFFSLLSACLHTCSFLSVAVFLCLTLTMWGNQRRIYRCGAVCNNFFLLETAFLSFNLTSLVLVGRMAGASENHDVYSELHLFTAGKTLQSQREHSNCNTTVTLRNCRTCIFMSSVGVWFSPLVLVATKSSRFRLRLNISLFQER